MKKFSDLFFIMAIWSMIIAFMMGCNNSPQSTSEDSKQTKNSKSVAPSINGIALDVGTQTPNTHTVKKAGVTFPSVSQQLHEAEVKKAEASSKKSRRRKKRQEEVEEPTMPTFALSAQHQKTCQILPGDQMPAFSVKDLSGQDVIAHNRLGRTYTVIVFWNSNYHYALEAISDLQRLIETPFSSRGVKLLTINVGDSSETIDKIAKQYSVDFEMYEDKDAAAWKQFTQGDNLPFPRFYLVDPTGKVIWMDLEYSRTTRRDLTNALLFQLQ